MRRRSGAASRSFLRPRACTGGCLGARKLGSFAPPSPPRTPGAASMTARLRTIGRPEELRHRLFSRSLDVVTATPPSDPGQVFTGLPAVESWHAVDGSAGVTVSAYRLAVSDPAQAAPEVTRALV